MKSLDNRSVYGAVPPRVSALVQNALLTEENTMKLNKKRYAVVLIAAMMILALACTAVAVSLSQSARHNAVKEARAAMLEKYGITGESLVMFEETVTQKGGEWTVTYTAMKYNPDKVGEYTVTIADDKETAIAWTHDGVDLAALADEGTDAPVWGQAQLLQAVALEKVYYAGSAQTSWDEMEGTTIEKQAKRDQVLVDAGMESWVVHVTPAPEDLQESDALQRARQAIVQKYGVTEESLADFEADITFSKRQDQTERSYRIWLTKADGTPMSQWYDITVLSPSGKVDSCRWSLEPELRTLPEGPLAGYKEAVEEFFRDGAFAILSPARKAEIAARVTEAGFGALLEGKKYAMPRLGYENEYEAYPAAHFAMILTRGFDEGTLALFKSTASMLQTDAGRVWEFLYTYERPETWNRPYEERMGEYRVTVGVESLEVLSVEWSLDEARGDTAYTAQTFGQSPAFDAEMLFWLIALEKASVPIRAKYAGGVSTIGEPWPMEDDAAYDQLYRDAGFSAEQYPNDLPGEGDVPMETALTAAKQALRDEFGFTEERIEASDARASFLIQDPAQPQWRFVFFFFEDGYSEEHIVTVDAKTGDVVNTSFHGMGNG